jgi:DNA end-binding protein Ku
MNAPTSASQADPAAQQSGTDLSVASAAGPRGRASWSGLLKLSLVAVPVKAYPATSSSQEIHLNQLHAGCGQRIRHEKCCPLHGKIEAGALVSGYQYAPDQYVVVNEADLDNLRPVKDRALCLERFLDAGQLDPALFSGRSLYLLPDGPAAHHPYTVLAQSMQQRGKWAMGRIVLSNHRYLVALRPANRILVLHVLHYPAQLRASTPLEAEVRQSVCSEAEQELAGMLIQAASQPIPWAEYRDDRQEQLHALVEATVQGRRLEAPIEEEAPVLQLLDALKQSVTQALGQQEDKAAQAPQKQSTRKRTSRRSA